MTSLISGLKNKVSQYLVYRGAEVILSRMICLTKMIMASDITDIRDETIKLVYI